MIIRGASRLRLLSSLVLATAIPLLCRTQAAAQAIEPKLPLRTPVPTKSGGLVLPGVHDLGLNRADLQFKVDPQFPQVGQPVTISFVSPVCRDLTGFFYCPLHVRFGDGAQPPESDGVSGRFQGTPLAPHEQITISYKTTGLKQVSVTFNLADGTGTEWHAGTSFQVKPADAVNQVGGPQVLPKTPPPLVVPKFIPVK